jgi:uncharacterized beta-barrel protein YwiB (DUF1934 family)
MIKIKVLFRSSAGGVEFRKIYDGTMQKHRETVKINYEEVDENGVTQTEINIVGKSLLTVKRVGQFSNYLEFHEGYNFEGEYLTPYGKIPVEAFTKSLCVEYADGFITVSAKYKSSLMCEVTENEFCFTVKPSEKQAEV